MPETQEKVRKDLETYFSDKFRQSPYFETYVRIGSSLSSEMRSLYGLGILEVQLQTAFRLRLKTVQEIIFKEQGKRFALHVLEEFLTAIRENRFARNREAHPYAKYAKMLYTKLLSSVLYEWEKAHGFTEVAGGKVDVLVGNPGKLFNEQLKEGRVFKDIGAGKEHGEFTHRIQWFIVGEGLMMPNAGAVYRDVAKFISREPLKEGNSTVRRYLWEYLFDRDGDPSNAMSVYFKCIDKSDFRAPSNLNRYLIEGPMKHFKILRFCLTDRLKKRSIEGMDSGYVAKKAPMDPHAPQLKRMAQGVQGEDAPLVLSLNQGLFITRPDGEIAGIRWQVSPD